MFNRVLDDQLRAHQGLVESLADQLSRRKPSERDDLIQEGLIECWRAIEAHEPITPEAVEKRMKKWLRYRGRQQRDIPSSYDTLLSMEAE